MHELRTLRRRLLIIGLLLAPAAAAASQPPGGPGAAVATSGPAAAVGLAEALRATLRNHPAVAGQRAELRARHHAADGARSQRYPTLVAQAAQHTERNRSAFLDQDLSNPAVLRVRQPIWAFGRISSSIAVADAAVGTEQADLLRVRRQLLEDTAVAYAQVRGSRERIHIARQNVAEHEDLLAQIERRVEGKLASSADARLAVTRLAQARAQLEHAISEWQGADDDLIILTQVSVDAERPLPPDLLELPDGADLLERALANSADILVKERQLNQAEANVGLARTSTMPTLYLQADRYYDQPGLGDDSQISVVFEGSLEGLGFAARSRTGEAAAGRLAASQDLAATRLALRREIESLQRSRRLQTELISLQTDSLAELESLLASYRRQYESGTKSWLDLMNIQRELFEQRRALVQAQSDREIYSLRLLARTGELDRLAGVTERPDG